METKEKTLLDFVAEKRPRDNAGPRSSNRFNYQNDWAVIRMFEAHLEGLNYIMIFDYHEDVIMIIREKEQERGRFYQIKTNDRDKKWSLTDLVRSKKSKDNIIHSILGKMRFHELFFKDNIDSISFVSNEKVAVTLEDGNTSNNPKYCLKELDQRSKKIITKAMTHEFPDTDIFNSFHIYWIERTELPITEHSIHALGKTCAFLDAICPDRKCKDATVYKTIADEVKLRSDYEHEVTNKNELLIKKGMTRQYFEENILSPIMNTQNPIDLPYITTELQKSGIDHTDIREIKTGCLKYEAKTCDASDKVLQNIRMVTIDTIKIVRDSKQKFRTLMDEVTEVIRILRTRDIYIPEEITENFLKSIVIVENEKYI